MRFIVGGPRLFGLRTGVLLSPRDLGFGRGGQSVRPGGGFIYVIKGDHGHVKVGVSTNPIERLASLQTGSPFKLWIAYAGALTDLGYGLEAEAHEALDRFRLAGEWFDCSTEVAVGAVSALAHKRGEKIASVSPELIPEIVRLCALAPPEKTGRLRAYALSVFFVVVAGGTMFYLANLKIPG